MIDDPVIDYAITQFKGKLCFHKTAAKVASESTHPLYQLPLVGYSRVDGLLLVPPPFPHGINLKYIRSTIRIGTTPSLMTEAITAAQQQLYTCNQPVHELIAIYNIDILNKMQEMCWTPAPESDFDTVWNFQYQKAIAWYYVQEMQQLFNEYPKANIRAAFDIMQEFGLLTGFRKQAILRIKLQQLRQIAGTLS